MRFYATFISFLTFASTAFGCQDLVHSDITIGRGTTILYFYAPGCQACEAMQNPIREVMPQLMKKYGVSACYRINVSGAGAEIADDFNIRSVPTFVIMHKVDAVHDTAEALRNELEPLMKTVTRTYADQKPSMMSAVEEDLLDEHDAEAVLVSQEDHPEAVTFVLHDTRDKETNAVTGKASSGENIVFQPDISSAAKSDDSIAAQSRDTSLADVLDESGTADDNVLSSAQKNEEAPIASPESPIENSQESLVMREGSDEK